MKGPHITEAHFL